MTDQPEGETPPDDDDPLKPDQDETSSSHPPTDDGLPVQGQVRHSNVSARIPESVGNGVFSNGVMILTGALEIVIDFVLRMGEQHKVVSRCVIPHTVAQQLANALRENIDNYEKRFGPVPGVPKPLPPVTEENTGAQIPGSSSEFGSHPENAPEVPKAPTIEELYDELKIPDTMMSGHYANAVLIRHSGTEFCFDFITNFYPRSAVSARVFLAAPHVKPFLSSLERSINPPGSSQDFA